MRLVRPARRSQAPPVVPDAAQRRVLDHPGGPLLVLAGPGTGKTATVVEVVAARVAAGLDPESVLVLTFSRRAAGELRDRLAARLRRTTTEPLARTFHSYAFGLLRRDAVRRGAPEPRLLPAADADLALRELLAGRRVDAAGGGTVRVRPPVPWPPSLVRASTTAGFATEVHDLLSRAAERGVGPLELAELATSAGRDDWAAAADLAAEYEAGASLTGVAWTEAATLVRDAVDLLTADPAALTAERSARRLVVVDEFQDCDPAQVELLHLVAGGGADLVAVGDPDQAIYAFRGSDRSVVDDFATRFATAAGQAPVLALATSRRAGSRLLEVSRAVASRIPGPAGHRLLVPAGGLAPGSAEVAVHASPAAEREWLAGRLRAAALREGLGWSQMAVVVRTGAQLGPVRRALRAAGVPVTAASDPVPVASRPAARDLLLLAELALGAACAREPVVGGPREPVVDASRSETVLELLTGPFGRLDAVAVRRVQTALAGASAGSAGVLDAAFGDPSGPAADLVRQADARAGRLVDLVAAGVAAATGSTVDPGALLWALWEASGRARSWTEDALRGGPAGSVADRHLDAVVTLFDAVERYSEEHVGAGAREFLEAVTGRALPDAAERPAGAAADARGAVAVLTAHASKGLQWPLVAVVGVQERVWPDLRSRPDLLGQRALLRWAGPAGPAGLAGPAGTEPAPHVRAVLDRTEALAEERRLFYVACTRASAQLVLSAVDDRDDTPSRFLTELTAAYPALSATDLAAASLDTSALVASLRRVVCDQAEAGMLRRRAAAHQLARLASAGVPGAAPEQWWARTTVSDARPRLDPDEEAVLSPSRVEDIGVCQLRWFLIQAGGQRATSRAQRVGTLVHALAEKVARRELTPDDLPARLEVESTALGLGTGWVDRVDRNRLVETVDQLASWFRAQAAQGRVIVDAELSISHEVQTPDGAVRLTGRVDLVDEAPEDRLRRVVDFKTGRTAKKEAEAAQDLQLATYQVALGDGGPTGGAVLVYLAKSRKDGSPTVRTQPGFDGTVPDWLGEALAVAGSVVRAGEFTATPSAVCEHCSVRTSCPAQPSGAQVTA